MCPHASIYVSSRRIYEHAVKVEALQALLLRCDILHTIYTVCPHTTIYILYISPHTTIYAVKVEGLQAWLILYYIVSMLIYMCPHTTTYLSPYYYICVLILLHMCPHTTTYLSSYYYICVLILLHMCPHTTIYVSSCRIYEHAVKVGTFRRSCSRCDILHTTYTIDMPSYCH
jgi:hypothetical protein